MLFVKSSKVQNLKYIEGIENIWSFIVYYFLVSLESQILYVKCTFAS